MNIFFTLDYELFLGDKTGTPENCLIRPMDELCKLADKFNFKYIIFVDATYLLRMQQLKGRFKEVDRQYGLVSNHVRKLAGLGHDIELHFHPQWLYSDWDVSNQRWVMDRDHYKLSDMPISKATASLKAAKELLDGLIGYKTNAFRAGGFCMNEFKAFSNVFRELGLMIDSSVARFSHITSDVHFYDYRVVPREQIYHFNDSNKVKDSDGAFTELSITGYRFNPLYYIMKIRPLITSKAVKDRYGDGSAISDNQSIISHRIKSLFRLYPQLASIDGGSSNLLELYYERSMRDKHLEIVFIGHPKNTTEGELSNLNCFLSNHSDLVVYTTKNLYEAPQRI